jgi:methylenetetrahydrofolate reductase (NADPH)
MAVDTNRFAQALSSTRFLVTAGCLPPRGADADAVRSLSNSLPRYLDAVVVSDNPDEIRGSALSTATALGRGGHSGVILSMATRDRNRIALLSDAMGASALGISAILCMSGNHQSLGICPQAAAANDFDSIQFTQALKRMALQEAEYYRTGREPGLDLQIGAVAHPYLRPMELNLLRLRKKIAVGADFLLTQAVFDFEAFAQWMTVVRAAGFDKRTAILASVLPLTSLEKARVLQKRRIYGPIGDEVVERIEKAADPEKEGIAMAAEIAARLKEMPGVRGIHILSGGCEPLAEAVIEQASLLH